jgi:hypothetical protein
VLVLRRRNILPVEKGGDMSIPWKNHHAVAGTTRPLDPDLPCESCQGTGIVACKTCDGSGELDGCCPTCSGSGEGMTDGSTCSTCHGSGGDLEVCDDCHGHGEAPCMDCDTEPTRDLRRAVMSRREMKQMLAEEMADNAREMAAEMRAARGEEL